MKDDTRTDRDEVKEKTETETGESVAGRGNTGKVESTRPFSG